MIVWLLCAAAVLLSMLPVARIHQSSPSHPISPKFVPLLEADPRLETATFAAGCFWGVENIFRKEFQDKGLVDLEVGYTGGELPNPTYKDVCTNLTGHAEAVQILYDQERISYEELVDVFFRMHDPTQVNRQGPDLGAQYRSAIFTANEEQAAVAAAVRDRFQASFWKDPIRTTITPREDWWGAEEYHQRYLQRNKDGYECPTHFLRTEPVPFLERSSKLDEEP